MTFIPTIDPQEVTFGNTIIDSFGRQRTADPVTIFDSKQLWDNAPLFWDDQETSGTGTGSSHSTDQAATTISVSASTAGTRVRQTFQRFNYQPGKSQLIMMTGIIGSGGSGITSRIGYFDQNDGLFFQVDDGVPSVVIRSSVSGSPVDTVIPKSSWTIDGESQSGFDLDLDMVQIFIIDFEWLGVGSIRFGFVRSGQIVYVHEQSNANLLANVYMSTPNNPLRYELSNDGTGGVATVKHICTSVISEGGHNPRGKLTYVSTGITPVDADDQGTIYAIVGIRLKSTHLDAVIDLLDISMLGGTTDNYEWLLIFNPTVAGTFTYADVTNSCLQRALGVTANTVTNGQIIAGGYVNASGSGTRQIEAKLDNSLRLGSAIDGTPTTIVLCVRPLTPGADISGGIVARELD